jgi:hypothetical protein
LPESPWRDPSGECFQIIGIAKRLDIAQTRGDKSAFKPPLTISKILCTISAKFSIECYFGLIGVVLEYHEISDIFSGFSELYTIPVRVGISWQVMNYVNAHCGKSLVVLDSIRIIPSFLYRLRNRRDFTSP